MLTLNVFNALVHSDSPPSLSALPQPSLPSLQPKNTSVFLMLPSFWYPEYVHVQPVVQAELWNKDFVAVCSKISEADFMDSVLVLNFGEEVNQILLQVTMAID